MPATAETIVDVADRLFTAIEKSDMAAVDRMWSDDIAVWRAGARRDPAKTDDKARALRVIASSSSTSCTQPAMPANRSRCGSAS